jgi:excisionase family DNA binding protein
MEPDYTVLSKEEVAKLLLCEENTVEEKARTGQLPAVKIGRSWVFLRHTLFAKLFEMSLDPKISREGESVHARNVRAKENATRLLGRRPGH